MLGLCTQGVCGERKGVVVWWCGAVSGVLCTAVIDIL
jgi:hypothetical protein